MILASDGVVLPGVGNFGNCAKALNDSGVRDVAIRAIRKRLPFLGICVGMQIMASSSEEGKERGLNWINAEIVKFKQDKNVEQLHYETI